MKVVIQRVKQAWVEVQGTKVGAIEQGLVLLVCLEKGDDQGSLERAANKLISLRTFDDPATQKMGLSIVDAKGEFLCVSQFTLSWDGKKGNRPGWDRSMPPLEAKQMFAQFCQMLAQHRPVQTGSFGEHMKVFIENDGPVTYSLDF